MTATSSTAGPRSLPALGEALQQRGFEFQGPSEDGIRRYRRVFEGQRNVIEVMLAGTGELLAEARVLEQRQILGVGNDPVTIEVTTTVAMNALALVQLFVDVLTDIPTERFGEAFKALIGRLGAPTTVPRAESVALEGEGSSWKLAICQHLDPSGPNRIIKVTRLVRASAPDADDDRWCRFFWSR